VYADSTLREVANELARRHATEAAVTDRAVPGRVVGEISLDQLLHARRADLHEDEHRERPLPALVTRAVPPRRERTTVGPG
jgi:CBS domain-containing protein